MIGTTTSMHSETSATTTTKEIVGMRSTTTSADTASPSASTATSTAETVEMGEFVAVDGGSDRACRGASKKDSQPSYYTLKRRISSLDACKNHCKNAQGCVGIEYRRSRSRCEVWTRPEGIGATVKRTGFQCFRFTSTTSTTTSTMTTSTASTCRASA